MLFRSDLGAVAHLATIKGRVPFLNFFDGVRTSHEITKVAAWDYKDLAEMVDWDAVAAFRNRSLNPETNPMLRFFVLRERYGNRQRSSGKELCP